MNKKRMFLIAVLCFWGSSCVFSANGYAPLDSSEKQNLRDVIKKNQYRFPVDVTYTREETVRGDIAAERLKATKNKMIKIVVEKHGVPESELTFRPPGFFESPDEYVVLTLERIRMAALNKVRKDITYFSGEISDSNIVRDVTNVYDAGRFYYIDKRMRKIELSDRPRFESMGVREVLSFAKTGGDLRIAGDIVRICDPNSNHNAEGMNKKTFIADRNGKSISGIPIIRIECVDANNVQRKHYEFFVDSNDWGKCYKVLWYDSNTGKVRESTEFSDFSKAGEIYYPQRIVYSHFEDSGRIESREVIDVLDAQFGKTLNENVFDITKEFGDYEIKSLSE